MSGSAEAPGSLIKPSAVLAVEEDATPVEEIATPGNTPPAPPEEDSSSAAPPPTPGSPPATPPPQPSTPPPSSDTPPPSSPPPLSPPPTAFSPPASPPLASTTPPPPAPSTVSPPPPETSPQPKPPPSPPPPSTTTSPPPSPPQKASPPPPSTTTSPPPSPPQKATPPSTAHPFPPPTQPWPSSPPANATASPPPPGAVVEPVSPPPPAPAEFIPPPASPLASGAPNLTPPSTTSPPLTNSPAHSPSKSSPSDKGISKASGSPPVDGSCDSSGDAANKPVVGAAVAGVLIIALFAMIFLGRRRKKRKESYASHYMPPNNFTVKTDGFYYGQQPTSMGFPGAANHSWGSQQPHSPLGDNNNSYDSQRGNMFNAGGAESGVIGGSKSFFSYEEMMEMTGGFARQTIIGEGGFGCVYKGALADGKVVAVKQLKAGSGQGDREFKAEVEIISRVHHRHLVSLVGYCIADRQRLLVYEFVPNNTLEHHLHTKGMPVLDWPKRLRIAVGSAKGLAYLHEDCNPKIIHRDIKSANILLDDAFEAQVADFGLARLNDTTQTHVSTRVMGTFGYLAPEYASSGKLTDRSDVYSFGVVLLELITGRKPVDPTQPLGDESLVEWARPLLIQALETGVLNELADPRLEKHYVESEMIRMIETAAACVRHSAPKRPRMVQVVRALDCDNEMSDLSNGVKYGQSTVYDSGQYNQEIVKFRRLALGRTGDSSEFETFSGDTTSRDISRGPPTSGEFTSSESETRAMTQPGIHGMQGN